MQYDFKSDWPKVKKQLMQFSQEALTLAKQGEKELVKGFEYSSMDKPKDAVTINV